jgi:4-hydroxybenzoate polyprenyltransferase
VVVSLLLHNFAVLWVKLLGIVSGYLYNAEPIRLKRRGLWNPIMMSIRCGFVPGLIAYLCVHGGRIGAGGWLVLVGMTFAAMSYIGFWASVSDTDEDTAEQIRTASVEYGPLPTMRIAIALMVACTLLTGLGLALLFGPWAVVGAIGALGVLVYRIRVLRRTTDDRSAIALLRTTSVLRGNALWDRLQYGAVIAVGVAHFLFFTG